MSANKKSLGDAFLCSNVSLKQSKISLVKIFLATSISFSRVRKACDVRFDSL